MCTWKNVSAIKRIKWIVYKCTSYKADLQQKNVSNKLRRNFETLVWWRFNTIIQSENFTWWNCYTWLVVQWSQYCSSEFDTHLYLLQLRLTSRTSVPFLLKISDDTDVEMTFNEIRIKAIRAATNLKRLGFKTKSIFEFMARNSANVAPIVFASLFSGYPLNTLDWNFGKVELIRMLKTTKPCLMFCDLNLYDLVAECLKEVELKPCIFTFDGERGDSKSIDSLFIIHCSWGWK